MSKLNIAYHPLNLALRFALELSSLTSVGFWGWHLSDEWFQYPLAIGIPLLLAICWGTFAVPNDRSRSGKAPISIPGLLRLILELILFSAGSVALFNLNLEIIGACYTLLLILHHVFSIERIQWLLNSP